MIVRKVKYIITIINLCELIIFGIEPSLHWRLAKANITFKGQPAVKKVTHQIIEA